jgi:hypothetical protein
LTAALVNRLASPTLVLAQHPRQVLHRYDIVTAPPMGKGSRMQTFGEGSNLSWHADTSPRNGMPIHECAVLLGAIASETRGRNAQKNARLLAISDKPYCPMQS